MIFKCNLCKEEIENLRTPGDEINDNFICPPCAEGIKETLKRARELIQKTHNGLVKIIS